MRTLSNSTGDADPGRAPQPGESLPPDAPAHAVQCGPVDPAELTGALQLLLRPSRHGHSVDAAAVDDFRQRAGEQGLDLGAMWVARSGNHLVWSLLPVVYPGRSMLLIVPGQPPSGDAARPAAPKLIEACCLEHAQRGVHLAQVLLETDQPPAERLLCQCGFVPLTTLHYLERGLTRVSAPALPTGVSIEPSTGVSHGAMADAIAQTYHGSLDCPELNGVRTMDDVIAGHKATGRHDPSLWFILRRAARDCGVLLLSPTVMEATIELVYLGLAEGARGQGLGDVLMHHAVATAWTRGYRRLTLAVDVRNGPAINLYLRHGMQRTTARRVFVRDLRASAGARPLSQAAPDVR